MGEDVRLLIKVGRGSYLSAATSECLSDVVTQILQRIFKGLLETNKVHNHSVIIKTITTIAYNLYKCTCNIDPVANTGSSR